MSLGDQVYRGGVIIILSIGLLACLTYVAPLQSCLPLMNERTQTMWDAKANVLPFSEYVRTRFPLVALGRRSRIALVRHRPSDPPPAGVSAFVWHAFLRTLYVFCQNFSKLNSAVKSYASVIVPDLCMCLNFLPREAYLFFHNQPVTS